LVPSLLGTELISYAREVFADQLELRRQFRGIARAVLADIFQEDRDIDIILQSILIFLVRRSALDEILDRKDIDELINNGLLRQILDKSGESMFVVRLPELLAAELATELANNAVSKMKAKENPAEWLSKASRMLPFGDVITAQAILDSDAKMGGLPMDLLLWFLKNAPTQKTIKAGTAGRMLHPKLGPITVEFKSEGVVHLVAGGQRVSMNFDPKDFGSLSDIENWLILSHVAAHPIGIQSEDGTLSGRFDPELLLQIGSSPFVLRRLGSSGYSSHLVHSIRGYGEIVCHKAGFIEPIIMAIYKFLSRGGEEATDWVEEAINRQSLPLLHRICLVLDALKSSTDAALASWSTATKENIVTPALSQFPPFRCDPD
jgi:hypothetical protein